MDDEEIIRQYTSDYLGFSYYRTSTHEYGQPFYGDTGGMRKRYVPRGMAFHSPEPPQKPESLSGKDRPEHRLPAGRVPLCGET